MINSLPIKIDNETLITCIGIPFVCDSNLIGRKLLMYRHALAVQKMGKESGSYLKLLRNKTLSNINDIIEVAQSRKVTNETRPNITS